MEYVFKILIGWIAASVVIGGWLWIWFTFLDFIAGTIG